MQPVRGLICGVMIAALCIPADCRAQQASKAQSSSDQPQIEVSAIPVRPQAVEAGAKPLENARNQLVAQAQAPQGMGSGIAGGLGAAAVYDEQKRPITAGGFVDFDWFRMSGQAITTQ